MVVLDLLIMVVSMVILIQGSDFFVTQVTHIARLLKASDFVIGLTIVAFGTSLPELSSSIAAALYGNTELIMGNVIGSNLSNIALVLGIVSIISLISISKEVYDREGVLLLALTVLFYIMSLNGIISFMEGILLLLIFVVYLLYLKESDSMIEAQGKGIVFRTHYFGKLIVGKSLNNLKNFLTFDSYKDMFTRNREFDIKNLVKYSVFSFIGFLIIIYSSKYLVNSALSVAEALGIGAGVVGLTVIAIGTSLPELFVSIMAAKRGKGDLVVGTILGSNIYNILIVVGISAIVSPLVVTYTSLYYSIPMLLLMTAYFMWFIRRDYVLRRREGIILLTIYLLFMGGIFLSII
jgi:cation:H+ antiporter